MSLKIKTRKKLCSVFEDMWTLQLMDNIITKKVTLYCVIVILPETGMIFTLKSK